MKFEKKAFGDVVSTLIMFIAIVSVTTGLVIAFQNYVGSTQQSLKVQNEVATNKLKTVISISNIYYNSSSENLYIYVKNIGETKLKPREFDVFVDESYHSDFEAFTAGNLSQNSTLFQPLDTIALVKQITLGSGTHEVRLVSEYGVGDSDSFNI